MAAAVRLIVALVPTGSVTNSLRKIASFSVAAVGTLNVALLAVIAESPVRTTVVFDVP